MRRIRATEARRRKWSKIQALYDVGPPPPTHLLLRGNEQTPGPEMSPGFLSVLCASDDAAIATPSPPFEGTSGRRAALARWLTQPGSPSSALLARVMVNRVWTHLFGEGIVPTQDNFGIQGQPPTHPELLEWLSSELVASGWRLKPLIRLMTISTAYRQASRREPEQARATSALAEKIDPGNSLLWKMRLRRIEAETVRDAILATSGDLDQTCGGPPVKINARPDGMVIVAQGDPAHPAQAFRRSIYLTARRAYNVSLLTVFDQPLVATNCLQTQDIGAGTSISLHDQRRVSCRASRPLCEKSRGISASPRRRHRRPRIPNGSRQETDSERDGHLPRSVAESSCTVSIAWRFAKGLRSPRPHTALPDSFQFQRVSLRRMKPPGSERLVHRSSRRAFLEDASLGFGSLALAHLLQQETAVARSLDPDISPRIDLRARPGHFPAPARSVILLMQVGGPSQIDLFDPKPELRKRDGQIQPDNFETLQPGSENKKLMGSPFEFRPHGQCGMELSNLIPHIGSVADDLCLVRSMHSDNNNHPQASRCLLSGKIFPGRPSVGSWISYALGTENQNLPAYVVLRDPDGYTNGGTTLWESGWLPAIYQGTEIQSRGAAVLNLHPATSLPEGIERNNLDALARLNEEHRKLYPRESELEARIRNYELAAAHAVESPRPCSISAPSQPPRANFTAWTIPPPPISARAA